MPKKYCSKCNKGTDFSDSAPLYCGSCGKPFAGVSINSIASQYEIDEEPEEKPRKRIIKRASRPEPEHEIDDNELIIDESEYDEEEDTPVVHRSPKIKIKPEELCEITLPRKQTETLGQLILDTSKPQEVKRESRSVSKKQFLKEWQDELASKKPSQEIGGNGR